MALDYQWFEEMEQRIPRGEVRTRFAPSPTGYMHVGNLRTALYTYLIARHNKGKFILRIEDTDQKRKVEDAVAVIKRTMESCNLDYDEGPDVGGPVGPYVQTERMSFYQKYAELLVEKGLAYRCFCTEERLEQLREEATAQGQVAKYDGHCSRLSQEEIDAKLAAGEPYVIRQKIPAGSTTFHDAVYGDVTVDNAELDDQILIKSDGLPTYNFANVIDDHLMGIPRGPRQRVSFLLPQIQPVVRGLWLGDPHLCPLCIGDDHGPGDRYCAQDVQAPRRPLL